MFKNICKTVFSKKVFWWLFWQTRGLLLACFQIAVITILGMLPFPTVVMFCQYPHFTPIQKRWFPTYVQTEFSWREWGIYRLLLVEGADKKYKIACQDNVQAEPAFTLKGETLAFTLAKSEAQAGKRLVLLPPMRQNNVYLW